jgi:hypothetical protein
MTPLDLTSAAAHERVHDLRDAAAASRLAARAACGRTSRHPAAVARLRAALHLERSTTDC